MVKLRIALGDLRYNTIGMNNPFMPLGIGYITSYLYSQVDRENIDLKMYLDPQEMLNAIDQFSPHVIGLSHYCWNSELSNFVFEHAKSRNPDTICIAGGPQFPDGEESRRQYLIDFKAIDFFCPREGEIAFSRMIKKILKGVRLADLKEEPQEGLIAIHPRSDELMIGGMIERILNLDVIPSPYLNGIMNEWFNGKYGPAIETTRGCPYSCAYCYMWPSWKNDVANFSYERVKAELTYIAKRMKKYPHVLLQIYDSNFGMFERDEKISEHISELQNIYGWPNIFSVATSKGHHDRVIRMVSKMGGKMNVGGSMQSLNAKTLNTIKRKNVSFDKYLDIQKKVKQFNLPTSSELIMPLPEETKDSFIQGICKLLESGTDRIVPYTTMLLYGTKLSSKEFRDKFNMKTKYRLLPWQFGEFNNKKLFEIEEVCVATNTMSFDDYLECRGFSWICSLFSNETFDIVRRHLKELNIKISDYLIFVWNKVKSEKSTLSNVYQMYMKNTIDELWDTRDELIAIYKLTNEYNKLLSGELGDNLMRKYKTIALLHHIEDLFLLLYDAINETGKDTIDQKNASALEDAKKYTLECRNLSKICLDQSYRADIRNLCLNHDVDKWYQECATPLVKYRESIKYKITCDKNYIDSAFRDIEKLYSGELHKMIGKTLVELPANKLWCKCEKVF